LQYQQSETKDKNQSTTQYQKSSNKPTSIKIPSSENSQKTTDCSQTNILIEKAEERIATFTLYLAIIAFLQFIALIVQAIVRGKQTRKLSKTTIVSKKATEAALQNAQAVINTERAWIVISVESIVRNQFSFRATNVGKTPAKIISIYGSQLIVNRSEKLKIPEEYGREGGNTFNILPSFLPPTANRIFFQCSIEDLRGRNSVKVWLNYLAKGYFTAYFLGRIVYSIPLEGAVDTPHETRWLYMYVPIEGALPIPDPMHPEYNDCT